MSTKLVKEHPVESKPLYVRKLTKSGSTRYLSVGAFLPKNWDTVKVVVEKLDVSGCSLRLEPIK